MPSLKRSLIFTLTTLLSRVINLLTISYVIQTAGKDAFGLYQYHLSLVAPVTIVGLLGTSAMLFREFNRPMRHASSWLYHGLLARSVGVIASYCFLILFVAIAKIETHFVLLISVCLATFAETNIHLASSWLKARQQPWRDLVLTTTRGAVVFLAVVIALHFFPMSLGIAIGYFIGTTVCVFLILLDFRRPLQLGRRQSFVWTAMMKIAPVILSLELMGSIIAEMPIYYLGNFASFREVGLYAAYAKFLIPFAIPNISFDQSFQTEFHRATHAKAPLAPILWRGLKRQLLLGIGSGAILLVMAPIILFSLANIREIDWPLVLTFATLPLACGLAAMADNCLIALHRERLIVISHLTGLVSTLFTLAISPFSPIQTAALLLVLAYLLKMLVAMFNLYLIIRSDHGIP